MNSIRWCGEKCFMCGVCDVCVFVCLFVFVCLCVCVRIVVAVVDVFN